MSELRYQELEREIRGVANEALTLGGRPLPTELGAELDSVKRLILLVAIEDHFGVAFDPEGDAQIQTLNDLVLALKGKIP